MEKYLAAAKSDTDDDDAKDTLIAIQQLERQLQHHYELACKKAEMQENQRSAVLKKMDSITAELQRHAIKVENGLEGKKEILNEMILLEKEAWRMIDNTPTLPNFDEIDQVLENVSQGPTARRLSCRPRPSRLSFPPISSSPGVLVLVLVLMLDGH